MQCKAFILPVATSILVACGGGGGNDTNPAGPPLPVSNADGVWTSGVNGESFVLAGDTVRTYQHNSQFCLISEIFDGVSSDDIQANFLFSEDRQRLSLRNSDGTTELSAPIVWYEKAASLPSACDTPVAKKGDSAYRRDPLRDFDIFARTFSDFYLSFERKEIDWDASVLAVRANLSPDASDAQLMEALYELTLPLADAHVSVSSPGIGEFSADGKPTLIARLVSEYVESQNLQAPLSQSEIDEINAYISEQLALRDSIIAGYSSDNAVNSAAEGLLRWFTEDEVAYLEIRAMTGFAADGSDLSTELSALENALDRILRDIQDAQSLIIDVRENNGGRDFLAMAIASRFVGSRTLAFSKQSRDGNQRSPLEEVYIEPRGALQYLGPIALLTSNSTVSAAEVFSLIMRSLPNVTLVGESTQGAFSDALEKVLPNGFNFTLSNQFYFSSEGEWFEHVGMPVEIEAPYFTVEDRVEAKDSGLEAAFAALTGES